MSALLLSNPERMYKVRVIAPKGRSGEVLAALQRAGTLHVKEERAELERPSVEQRMREIEGLARALDELISRALPGAQAPPALAEDAAAILSRPFEELRARAAELAAIFKGRLDRISALEGELERLERLHGHLSRARDLHRLRLRDICYEGDYVFSALIAAKAESWGRILEEVSGYALLCEPFEDPEGVTAYILAKSSARDALLSKLEAGGAVVLRLPREDLSLGDYLLKLGERIEALRREIANIEGGLRDLVPDWAEVMMLRAAMAWELDRLLVLARAIETGHLVAIEGWVPESGLGATSKELEPLGYAYYDYEEADPSEEPPTKLRNPRGVRPFEIIINFFGTPKYTEWDPTPITAYSFSAFYGMMLGDAAYGLALILAASSILKKLVEDPEEEGFKLFRNMLYICGGAAVIFGILAGSYFGDAHEILGLGGVIRPVLRQLSEPFSLIIVSLGIGLIHVNIAHALSAIRGIKEGDRIAAIGKGGLFIAEFFGIAYIMHKFFDVKILPLPAELYPHTIYPTLIGIAILTASLIKQNGGLGGMLWIFELTGLMGDVLSYSRLAGVGMASFFLASAFNQMAAMVFKGISGAIPGMAGIALGGILSILVAAFTHILNFALSCLGAFIHSMRLCFVEFLPKFYNGGGRQYTPFKAKMRRAITNIGG